MAFFGGGVKCWVLGSANRGRERVIWANLYDCDDQFPVSYFIIAV